MPLTASRALVRQTERWFVRRGVPQMIAGYDFRRHVLPRMAPYLAMVALVDLAWFGSLAAGASGRTHELIGLAAVIAALAAWPALAAWSRRMPRFSLVTAWALLAGYAVLLAAVPLAALKVGWSGEGVAKYLLAAVATTAGGYLVVTYGLLPLLRSAVRHAIDDMRNSLRLQGRALPMLLFVTLFFFFTGELWQAMHRLGWDRVGAVLALFAAVTILASAGRLRDEIGRVERDLRPDRLSHACKRTPLSMVDMADVAPDGEPLAPVRLTNGQITNLLVILATRQLVQAAVVGLGLFSFFVLLGFLMVTKETAAQWIGAEPEMLRAVPVALLKNAAVLAGFGSMYFAVTSMIDAEQRHQFFAPILDEVERVLAVHAVYLTVRNIVLPNAPGGPGPRQPSPVTQAVTERTADQNAEETALSQTSD
ncbi:hypothetical protein Ais01nite_50360 [Asanoa ishikariensis]|uniref:Uncharacterized protein n=1 Tax=Asanoa ishikariensis TaxID=137265 RepID=A0A1H3RQ54_9ACTN|nr:hypothetical protein [Asanoa ishikariensis]GIF67001.1 hypothetical protein Ais01nite_50360 [Asanoa ishikariensis]SDZ27378.1 hypothetical protein SAMN05421684_4045 [Asanoa ishikariensis]